MIAETELDYEKELNNILGSINRTRYFLDIPLYNINYEEEADCCKLTIVEGETVRWRLKRDFKEGEDAAFCKQQVYKGVIILFTLQQVEKPQEESRIITNF